MAKKPKHSKTEYEIILDLIIADIHEAAAEHNIDVRQAAEGYLEGLRDDIINHDDL